MAGRMRILLANPYFLPFEGGIEGRMLGVARGLVARGHEVAVLTARLPGTSGEERMDGFTVLRCPALVWKGFPYNPPPLLAWGILPALEAWGADVVDFQYRWAPEWTDAMGKWARRAPLVFTWHNGFGEGQGPVGHLSAWNDQRFLTFLKAARRVICISDWVRRDLAARGVPGEAMTTIHAGFDPPGPDPAGDAAGNVAGGVPGPVAAGGEEGPHAAFVGRLVATKGLDVLLRALVRAPEVRVVLVGRGPEREPLRRLAGRLGVADRVTLAGWVAEAEKRRLVASARFLVHPARWESLGHAVAEAMLLGTPVVASDAGGLPEIVGPGGVLVPTGDAAALADAMRALWEDAPRRAALGKAAQAHAAGFTWDRCVARTEQVYREALDAGT